MQPVHGYDVRRELLSWSADEWANVAPGSIYHALRKLTEEGLLDEVATEQVGARPARTTYRIDAQGRRRSSRSCCATTGGSTTQPIDPFQAGVRVPAGAAARRGGRRAAQPGPAAARRRPTACGVAIGSDWMRDSKPTHVGWMFERSIAADGGRDPLVRADRRRGSRPARRRSRPASTDAVPRRAVPRGPADRAISRNNQT